MCVGNHKHPLAPPQMLGFSAVFRTSRLRTRRTVYHAIVGSTLPKIGPLASPIDARGFVRARFSPIGCRYAHASCYTMSSEIDSPIQTGVDTLPIREFLGNLKGHVLLTRATGRPRGSSARCNAHTQRNGDGDRLTGARALAEDRTTTRSTNKRYCGEFLSKIPSFIAAKRGHRIQKGASVVDECDEAEAFPQMAVFHFGPKEHRRAACRRCQPPPVKSPTSPLFAFL